LSQEVILLKLKIKKIDLLVKKKKDETHNVETKDQFPHTQ